MRTTLMLALSLAAVLLAVAPEAAAVGCEYHNVDEHRPILIGQFSRSEGGYVEALDHQVECDF